jgi:hypothetical protein
MTDVIEGLKWHCITELRKFAGDSTDEADLLEAPIVIEGNIVTYGGVSALWESLIGATTYPYFSNTNAAIEVGDSTTAAAATQTALQAATNFARVGMDATYPQHTAGTGSATNAQIVFRSTFGSAVGNFVWNEWGIFNNVTHGSGVMLNRKQEALGTKAANSTWQLTVTLSIA